MTYLAGRVVLGNSDDYVGQGHNYYLYEQTPGRFTIVPWDYNLSQSGTADGELVGLCPASGPSGQPTFDERPLRDNLLSQPA